MGRKNGPLDERLCYELCFLDNSIMTTLTDEETAEQASLKRFLFYEKGAMSFLDKEIPRGIVRDILSTSASSSWLGKWKLLAVRDRENRVRVVNVWQEALRRIGQNKGAEFIERWKAAPLFVAFCQPKNLEQFQFVPPEFVRIFSIQEIGGAVRSLELFAQTYGIGLHGIMGILVPAIGDSIKELLKIPADYEIVYFGIMGYPNEQVDQEFPKLGSLCYSERWGDAIKSS